jgi:hypothetical protein
VLAYSLSRELDTDTIAVQFRSAGSSSRSNFECLFHDYIFQEDQDEQELFFGWAGRRRCRFYSLLDEWTYDKHRPGKFD